MNDLSELLDETQPATCEFLGKTINLEVYTAGFSRLTHEESVAFREVTSRYREANERAEALQKEIKSCDALIAASPDDPDLKASLEKLSSEWDNLDTGSAEQMRVVIPMMLKGWSLNGKPMKRGGVDFPPTKENLATVPNSLLVAIGAAAQPVWHNPIIAESVSGSAQSEDLTSADKSQTGTTMPLVTSDSPQDGSTATP